MKNSWSLFAILFIFVLWYSGNSMIILELYCDSAYGLSSDGKCIKITGIGSEFKVEINEKTKDALLKIVKNDGNWFVGTVYYKDCTYINQNNWKCERGDDRFLKNEIGMIDGIFYRITSGGMPPHYYSSSMSNFHFVAYKLGILDPLSSHRKLEAR